MAEPIFAKDPFFTYMFNIRPSLLSMHPKQSGRFRIRVNGMVKFPELTLFQVFPQVILSAGCSLFHFHL